MPLDAEQPLQPVAVDVVPDHRVVEIVGPVDLDRARNVPGVVEQQILIRLDQPYLGIIQMLRHPVGGDQHLGMGVSALFDRGDRGKRLYLAS